MSEKTKAFGVGTALAWLATICYFPALYFGGAAAWRALNAGVTLSPSDDWKITAFQIGFAAVGGLVPVVAGAYFWLKGKRAADGFAKSARAGFALNCANVALVLALFVVG